MNHSLDLPGLREDILRDHLAGLGLLDWMTHLFPNHHPKLSWSASTGHALFHNSQPLPPEWPAILLDAIQSWRTLETNPLGHGKIEATKPAMIREILISTSDPRLIYFYSGMSSQLAVEGSGRRSELIIESARRSVLKGVDDLLADKRKPLDLAADLLGHGTKREVNNTSRWHPAEYQPAAHAGADPKENKHHDWPALNVLALLGVSFYPVLDTARGRTTAGFRRINGINEFSWPVWQHPLASDETRALLTHSACHSEPLDRAALAHLGVHRIWRSRRFSPDGKNDYFSSATPY
jgi:hypothetical protein